MRIFNLTDHFTDKHIESYLRIFKDDYMNTHINILEAKIYEGREYLEFKFIIHDDSKEAIPESNEKYLESIFDYKEYALDNDALIEDISLDKLLPEFGISNIEFKLTF